MKQGREIGCAGMAGKYCVKMELFDNSDMPLQKFELEDASNPNTQFSFSCHIESITANSLKSYYHFKI